MWIYEQASGQLLRPDGSVAAVGYSGGGGGKNNPQMQAEHDRGPLPQGFYQIGPAFDSTAHGPLALRLEPEAGNEMFGRGGFLMHGDSILHPGTASEGCIILPRAVREEVAAASDRRLAVVSGLLGLVPS